MKKNFDLLEMIKESVKEAILEAFAEINGVSTLNEDENKGKGPKEPDQTGGYGGFSLDRP